MNVGHLNTFNVCMESYIPVVHVSSWKLFRAHWRFWKGHLLRRQGSQLILITISPLTANLNDLNDKQPYWVRALYLHTI